MQKKHLGSAYRSNFLQQAWAVIVPKTLAEGEEVHSEETTQTVTKASGNDGVGGRTMPVAAAAVPQPPPPPPPSICAAAAAAAAARSTTNTATPAPASGTSCVGFGTNKPTMQVNRISDLQQALSGNHCRALELIAWLQKSFPVHLRS